MLDFQTYKPKLLHRFLNSFEFYQWRGTEDCSPFHYWLLPQGTIQLLFQFNSLVRHKTAFSNGWEFRPNTFIAGPYTKAYEMKITPPAEILVISFRPSMFKYFASISASKLKDQLTNPANLWGIKFQHATEVIQKEQSLPGQVKILERFLIDQFRHIPSSNIELSVQEMLCGNGYSTVDQYADMANLSPSRYRHKFSLEVGLSPKNFQKLVRVNAISRMYEGEHPPSLSELALRFNYFDQSHFIKDFKSVTDSAPKSYFQNRRFLQF